MRGDKVMFGADTGQPGLDIVDWAISHIGVPYALSDYTDKLPYEKIECSSFVTANRIQEIGPENNTKYAVAFITTDEYLQGYYFYDTRQIFITEQVDPCADPDIGDGRGYLLHLQAEGTPIPHIGIIIYLRYDCDTPDPVLLDLDLIHANGGSAPQFGRVRFENQSYDRYPSDTYTYTYLKYTD